MMREAGTTIAASAITAGGNRLLALASGPDLDFLASRGTRRLFACGDVLSAANEAAPTAHFVENGIASVVKTLGDRRSEVCLVGPEGFVGAPIILSDGRSPYETFVQTDGLTSLSLDARHLRQLFAESPRFRDILLGAAHVEAVQISENLVSAKWQRASARLARWLLMYRDRLDSHRLEVTHEFMAMMIGSQRTKVTEALHDLEASGTILATRGCVVIVDAPALERLADGAYGCAEAEAARIKGRHASALKPPPPTRPD